MREGAAAALLTFLLTVSVASWVFDVPLLPDHTPKDTDGDGVVDSLDGCPRNPRFQDSCPSPAGVGPRSMNT